MGKDSSSIFLFFLDAVAIQSYRTVIFPLLFPNGEYDQ